MRSNPLLDHLLRKTSPVDTWLTVGLAAALGGWVIASMQPGLDAMLSRNAAMPDSQSWLSIAALLVLLGAPVMIGVNAAAFTVRHADPANLKKLKLGDLTRAEKAWGYALGTLQRMRYPLALAVGFAPAPVIALTEATLTLYRETRPGCVGAGCAGLAAAPSFDVGYWLLIYGLLMAGAVGFSLAGAALGTWAALTFSRPVVGPAVVVACMGALTAGYVALVGPAQGLSLPVALAAGVGPYLVAAGVMGVAGLDRGDRGGSSPAEKA